MSFLKKILKGFTEFTRNTGFTPDFSKTEYDNLLDYLSKGGTSKEWEALKKQNKWRFKADPLEKNIKFEKEFRPVFNEYYAGVQKIKGDWSKMYNSKNYSGDFAEQFEKECLHNITTYKRMFAIESKYKKDHLLAVEGYKRLAMLYERQEKYEKAVEVCKEAILFGNLEEMKARLAIAIKKAGRTPTDEETKIMKK